MALILASGGVTLMMVLGIAYGAQLVDSTVYYIFGFSVEQSALKRPLDAGHFAVAYEISVDEARWYGSFIGLQPILDTLRLGGLYAGIGMLFVGGSGFASWGMVRLRPASSRLCQVGEPS